MGQTKELFANPVYHGQLSLIEVLKNEDESEKIVEWCEKLASARTWGIQLQPEHLRVNPYVRFLRLLV